MNEDTEEKSIELTEATYPSEATYPTHEPLRIQYFEREFRLCDPNWLRQKRFEDALRREGRTPGFF